MSSAASFSRPARQRERPNSAVYIGKDLSQLQHIGSTPPSLPDLPEPPSPVSSSGSGLPSPPATNSTGSGSTGDPASVAFRGGAKGNMPLLEEPYVKAFHSAFEQQQQQRSQGRQHHDAFDDDEDDINNNDYQTHDDETAKFYRSQNSNASNENAVALERVKNLQERNLSVLNKLSSYSRLSTPSPNPSNVRAKDTISRADSSSNSSSSSRPSNRSNRHSYHNDNGLHRDLSGSETERESARGRHDSFDDDEDEDDFHTGQPSSILLNHTSNLDRSLSAKTPGRPTTPTFREPALANHLSPRSVRTRLTSAPVSPAKALSSMSRTTSGSGGQLSPLSSPGRPRKRASMGLPSISLDLRGREDVTHAALAAVASSRRGLVGTTGTGKKRQPLPREFWEGSSSSSSMNGGGSVSRRGSLSSSDGHADEYDDHDSILQERDPSVSPSPISRNNSISSSSRNSRQSDTRYPATLTPGGRKRYYSSTRRTSGAWASEDLGNRTSEFGEDDGYSPAMGRRQNARPGGSADSVLTIAPGVGGRSLIGEGLKAAGLSKARASTGGGGGRDVFVTGSMRRDGSPVFERDRDREREERLERIRSQSRTESRPLSRGPSTSRHGRAVTSMAEYSRRDEVDLDDDIPPRTAPAHLRAYKSSYNLVGRDEMDRNRAPSSMSRNVLDDRVPQSATSSVAPPLINPATRRYNTINSPEIMREDGPPPSARRTGAIDRSDHTRLLNSSLDLFESALSKIPSSSSSSSASNTDDLIRNARVIVGAVEKLNGLLKSGHGRALNAQIECEVQAAGGGGGANTAEEVWRLVGGEYRESLRVSDDLVRAVTDFMLGVGRAVKDLGVDHDSLVNGDNHIRSVSLDEVGVSRLGRTSLSPDVTGGSGGARSSGSATSGGGRSRRSWDPTPGRDADTLRRITASRPETSLGVSSATHTPLNRTTGRAGNPRDNPPSASSSASMRRLLTPREVRDQQLMRDEGGSGGMSTLDSQETLHAASYEPSPTPASRAGSRAQLANQDRGPLPERSRTLPSHAIPPPLPILPSESRHQTPASTKTTQASSASTISRRRTTQVASTVRGPTFPLTTPNAPTTAVTTTHVSGSPEKRAFPLVRGNSNTSSGSGDSRGVRPSVTFSRSSTTTAVTGLQQQQQRAEQQRNRSLSNSSDLRDDSYGDTNVDLGPSSSKTPASGRVQRVTSGGGSETERDVYRRGGTVRDRDGTRAPRISFDEASLSIGVKAGTAAAAPPAHAADRAAMSTIGQKRERRRTVVDMWPRGGN